MATAGTFALFAASRYARRRSPSSAVESMTVVSLRLSRRSTMRSRTANASLLARWSCSPTPTTARSPSDDTTWFGSNHCCAQYDLPAPGAPTRTTRHGSGSRITLVVLLGDAHSFEAERLDGVAADELVDLVVAEAGLRTDLLGDLLRPRERGVGVRVVGLEADLVHADDVAVPQPDLVVEDAAVHALLEVARRCVAERR